MYKAGEEGKEGEGMSGEEAKLTKFDKDQVSCGTQTSSPSQMLMETKTRH